MKKRTRIKICGLTCWGDVQAAVAAGADALGFVFYPQSPRYIEPAAAARLIAALPPFVTAVGLFVNAAPEHVASVVAQAPVSLLQFHGDESAEQCHAAAQRAQRHFLRALRVSRDAQSSDLLKCEDTYRVASNLCTGLLLDADVAGYGGGGQCFDWSIIPQELASRIVLSGGLSVDGVAEAIRRVRPYAVDVSSGVEFAKGRKDAAKMHAFIEAVRQADVSAGLTMG